MDAKNVGRNDPCPCGSGKKYKKCCEEKVRHKKFDAQVISKSEKGEEKTKLAGKADKISSGFFSRIVPKAPVAANHTPPHDHPAPEQTPGL